MSSNRWRELRGATHDKLQQMEGATRSYTPISQLSISASIKMVVFRLKKSLFPFQLFLKSVSSVDFKDFHLPNNNKLKKSKVAIINTPWTRIVPSIVCLMDEGTADSLCFCFLSLTCLLVLRGPFTGSNFDPSLGQILTLVVTLHWVRSCQNFQQNYLPSACISSLNTCIGK